MFSYDQLPISTVPDLSDQIELTTELIGRGGYGSVYKGRWLGAAASATPAIIAIKIIELRPLRDKAKRTRRFKKITRELSLWCSIQHENILPLLGIARINADTNVPAFVCPWMENGNAMEFCERKPDFPPILILYDIINGLHYLHTSQPEIVHGDIKAVNVLINNRCEACLCDFGLSRFLTDDTLWKTTATQAGGTLRWMAPELMDGDATTPTKESDIYAYAMTCYEILSGEVPFKSVANDVAILAKVTKGQRPDRIESFHSDFMWDIITRCWEQEPEGRLPTEKVLELLRPAVDWNIDWKEEVKEAQAKIGEKDVALTKVEKEMVVLKEQVAEALAKTEEDLKALEGKEMALAKAEEDLKVSREEKDAALAKAEEEMKILRKGQAAAERKKNDVEGKYERKVEELQELGEQLEETVVMHQAEAAELRQETERAREDSSLLTEELIGLRQTNSSLHEVVERLKHEAKAREEEAVAVQQKQQNEIARLHEEVARVLAEAEKTSGNLKKAEVHRNQTKDQPDEVLSQFKEICELKQGMQEARTKIEEADVGLAEVDEEMAVLKEQKAEARMATHERRPYIGTEKSLVIGIDVGAAVSGVSYALLEPGKVPRIQPVTWFNRGQREEKPNSKVPSVVCYDQDGHVIAVGPETDPKVNPILSEIEGVRRAEWFKLRLRPPYLAADKRAQLEKIWSPPEPPEEIDDYGEAYDPDESDLLLETEGIGGLVEEPDDLPNKKKVPRPVTDDFKTAVQVFADFLHYLFKSAKEYIMETERYIDTTFTWSSIERNTYFVLTHPNGWEGKQQSQMREAAVAAGLVDRSTAADRIIFVTDGEASLHFCLDKNPELHQESDGLLVVDGGGGTIDLSAYSQTEKGGYKEIVSPDCLLQGSIFITSRARDYFKGKFKDSQFGDDDDVEAMARAFDKPEGAKCMFHNPNTPYLVRFGGLRDSDRRYGIANGKFKVEGAQVAKFFEPAIQDIIGGIINQCKNTKDGVSIKYVLLVGGFGRSDYLYTKLRDYFKSSGIVVLRPDNAHLHKAVADGSVSWYLDRYVSTRVARFSYGVMTRQLYNNENADHLDRESKKEAQANGKFCIPRIFVLKNDLEVSEETLFRQPHKFILNRAQFAAWTTISTRLKCYRGKTADPPKWVDSEPNSFHDACSIEADMSHIKQNINLDKNGTKLFYKLDLEVVVLLGFTELKAYVTWKEDGVEKRTDASIIYD